MKTDNTPITININITNSFNRDNSNAFNAYQSAISHGSDARLDVPGPSLGAILGAILDALKENSVPKAQQERIFDAVRTAIAGEKKTY